MIRWVPVPVMAVALTFLAFGSGAPGTAPSTSPAEPATRNSESYNLSSPDFRPKFERDVARLIQKIEQAPLDTIPDEETVYAVDVLGYLRTSEAVPVLADRISASPGGDLVLMIPNHHPGHFDPDPTAYCQCALIRIGVPALKPVLDHYLRAGGNAEDHVRVLVGILDHNELLAKSWLQLQARLGTDAKKRSIRQLLDTIERVSKEPADYREGKIK